MKKSHHNRNSLVVHYSDVTTVERCKNSLVVYYSDVISIDLEFHCYSDPLH